MANFNNPYVPVPGWPQSSALAYPASGQPYQQMSYTQPYQAQYASPQMSQANYAYANSVNNKNIIWVAGQAGAEAYQMEPGSRAVLLDSKDQIFYIKVVGPDGRPEPLMAFKYEPLNLNMQNESSQASQAVDTSNFATKDDLNQIMEYVKKLSQGQKGSKTNG